MDKSQRNSVLILHLPTELQEKIFSYLSFDEISRLRLVCRCFNRICQTCLNKGFYSVERFHASCLRNVKAQLPRRESERRNHPLARHCDILNSIETRLSLLSMTFSKYVDLNLCCFIPGKVIDEIYRVLRIIQNAKCAPRAHEVLQELRDISSMAMEHFDEKIVPILRQKMMSAMSSSSSPTTPLGLTSSASIAIQGSIGMVRTNSRLTSCHPREVRSELLKMGQLYKQNLAAVASLKKELSEKKTKSLDWEKKIQEQEKEILELNHLVADLNAKIMEQEGRTNEVNHKLLDYGKRIMFLEAERNRCIDEVSTPAAPSSSSFKRPHRDSNRVTSEEDVAPCQVSLDGPFTRGRKKRLMEMTSPATPKRTSK